MTPGIHLLTSQKACNPTFSFMFRIIVSALVLTSTGTLLLLDFKHVGRPCHHKQSRHLALQGQLNFVKHKEVGSS